MAVIYDIQYGLHSISAPANASQELKGLQFCSILQFLGFRWYCIWLWYYFGDFIKLWPFKATLKVNRGVKICFTMWFISHSVYVWFIYLKCLFMAQRSYYNTFGDFYQHHIPKWHKMIVFITISVEASTLALAQSLLLHLPGHAFVNSTMQQNWTCLKSIT